MAVDAAADFCESCQQAKFIRAGKGDPPGQAGASINGQAVIDHV
jgi:hypothetical protein